MSMQKQNEVINSERASRKENLNTSSTAKSKQTANISSMSNQQTKTVGGGGDIMKELEDYVNEKKQTNKFLDDISELDAISTTPGVMKERMSKKYKEKLAAEKNSFIQA